MVHIVNSCWLVLSLSLSIFRHIVNISQSSCFDTRSITISLFFFAANICKKEHIYCEAIQFSIVFIVIFKQEKKMLSKECSPKIFSKNIETAKCSIIRCHSLSCIRSSDKPWDESESSSFVTPELRKWRRNYDFW